MWTSETQLGAFDYGRQPCLHNLQDMGGVEAAEMSPAVSQDLGYSLKLPQMKGE